jgi:hypothetical protein
MDWRASPAPRQSMISSIVRPQPTQISSGFSRQTPVHGLAGAVT